MWNCKVLIPPPYCELKTSLTPAQRGRLLEARKCLRKCEEAIHDHVKLLTAELYVTKRIIYKLSNQFRSDKALKTLKQVHACMKRLEAIDLKKQVADSLQLVDRLPDSNVTEVYLTSHQVLEYHLVRLQGAAALLRQMVQYCQKTFIHVRQHLELGNMIPQNLVLLALTSRIWFISNSLGLYVSQWYGKLYPCQTVLKPTAVSWLQDEQLPADLSEWLTDLFVDIGLPEHFCSELEKSVEVEKLNGSLPSSVEFLKTDQEDVGELIQRRQLTAKPSCSAEVQPQVTQKHSKRKFEMNTEKGEAVKKQKPSVDSQRSDVIIDIGTQESTVELENKMHQQLCSTGTGDIKETKTLPEVNNKDLGSVKAHLEIALHTYEDVDNIVQQVKSGTVQIQGISWKLTKLGRKKIKKNIDRWKKLMQDKGSLSQTEKLFVKKVRGPLSELLVKHSQNYTGQEKKVKTGIGHRLDSSKDKFGFCAADRVVVDQIHCVDETSDVHTDHEKKRTEIEVKSNDIAEIGAKSSMISDGKSQTHVKKKAKKKKRKSKIK